MIQRRPYGSTGIDLSIVGIGGVVVMGMEQNDANRICREAFDRGVNYFDVAPSYGDAEERMGPAIRGLRDRIFLACKTARRTKAEAAAELRESLRRLETDHFDLYQLHALGSMEEVETCFGPGGAMEAFVEARDAGLVRYLGFSAHSAEAALSAMDRFDFTSILFPFNYTTYHQVDFGPQVLEKARQRGAARLALKAMARRPWPEGAERKQKNCWYEPFTDPAEGELALRWTLSLPITAAIPPGDPEIYRMALDFAERFTPLTEEEQKAVMERVPVNKPLFPQAA
jgi:aryl-alcohol dehydrogenase-like predicted oxidoreductase